MFYVLFNIILVLNIKYAYQLLLLYALNINLSTICNKKFIHVYFTKFQNCPDISHSSQRSYSTDASIIVLTKHIILQKTPECIDVFFIPVFTKGCGTMPKKKKGELPSGNIRRKVYDHSEPVFDESGRPMLDANGKQKMKKIYVSITAESAAEANRLVAEYKLNKNYHPVASDMTLYEAIDKYISISDNILSQSTIRGYRTIQRNAFRSIINIKISKLTTDMLKEAVNTESKRTTGKNNPKPISAKTISNEYGLISAVLNTYVPVLDTNIKLPQIEHNQHELSTPDVIYDMVKGTEMELPVMLAMWLSFTASEILGLTKSKSISSDGEFITIKEVIVKDEHGNEVAKNKGKQPTRDRTLRIPEYIKNLIADVPDDRLVPLTGAALSQRWAKLVKKTGIPHMTFHDLRHVNASIMTILNVPDKYAQERGGWKTDNIMKSTYMQTFSNQRKEVDQQVDNYMYDVIFNKSAELNYSKKYKCWLELFDKKDNDTNKRKFKKFCRDNGIRL